MCVNLNCPMCHKTTQGTLFYEHWVIDEKVANKYYSIQCADCDTVIDFQEVYKVSLELQYIKKEQR